MASTSGKDTDPCPICLRPIKQEAYLDHCFHAFCYPCIVQWSVVLTRKQSLALSSIKCPLCQTDSISIVHGFDGESFQQHYISEDRKESWFSSTHEFRLQWYGSDVRIPNSASEIQRFWKHRRYLRRNIWLEKWLTREIQALTRSEDVDVIVHHIVGVIESFRRKQLEGAKDAAPDKKREEFIRLVLDAAKPFVSRKTERFIFEAEQFLASGFNLEAYDEVCLKCLAGTSTDAEQD